MLDRHAVRALLRAGVRPRTVARQVGVSRRTVERIAREAEGQGVADADARGVGRPPVDRATTAAVRALLADDPALPPGEVWRRLKEAGTTAGALDDVPRARRRAADDPRRADGALRGAGRRVCSV